MGHQHEAEPGPGDRARGWSVPGERTWGAFPPGAYVVTEARGVFDRFTAEAESLVDYLLALKRDDALPASMNPSPAKPAEAAPAAAAPAAAPQG